MSAFRSSGVNKAKLARIDLGLAILGAIKAPGVEYSQDDLAAFCDCSRPTIQRIEKQAMAKVKKALREPGVERSELDSLSTLFRKASAARRPSADLNPRVNAGKEGAC